MIEHNIDIPCLQETKMPGSNMERKDTHTHTPSSFPQTSRVMKNITELDFASATK